MRSSQSDFSSGLSSQNWRIAQLPGINVEDQEKLKTCQIATTFQLLQQTRTLKQKQALVAQLQVHEHHVNKWIALADLARIPTVGCQYCGLLLHAGICSVAQLAQTPVHKLHQQILKLQVATLQRRDLCPGADEMAQWIYQAKRLAQLTKAR